MPPSCKVSVLMVTFNHRPFVRQAVESVLSQTCPDWEMVVVDDCSTDGTRQELEGLHDPRVRLIFREINGGICAAYRQGIGICAGEFIAFLEGDDRWRRTNLQEKLAVFAAHPEAAVVYSDVETVALEARPGERYLRAVRSVPPARLFDASSYAFHMNPIPTFSCAVARRIMLSGVTYPDGRFHPWLDWFFWNHLSLEGKFFFIPRPLVLWRRRPGSLYARTGKIGAMTKREEFLLRFRFLARFWRSRFGFLKKTAVTAAFLRGLARSAFNLLVPSP